MRVVLDTSTLISAIRSSTGASAEVVRLAILQKLTLLLDYKLVCEYRDVALRPRHILASGRTAQEVDAIIDALESVALPVLVEIKHRPMSQDENDDMVIDVAVNGRADVVVTNNVRDFAPAAKHFGIRVWTPGKLLIETRKGDFHHAREEERT